MEYFDLDVCRLRYFGGTSNHWGGWTRALDAVDFLPKPYAPLTGWPIGQIDLDPYRAEADAILDVPSATEAPDLPVRQTGYDFHRFQFRFSPPTRFAEKYLAEIEASDRITLVLNANLVDLRLDDALATVTGAVFRSYDPADPGFTVTARAYALCTGGHRERPSSPQLHQPGPRGHRQPRRLGRALLRRPPALPDRRVRAQGPGARAGVLRPDRALHARSNACLNFGLRLEPRWIWPYELPALGARGRAARGVQHPPRAAGARSRSSTGR